MTAPPARTPDYPDADPVRWAAVDAYYEGLLAPSDPSLDAALAANAAAGLPAQDVSALQGRLLALLVRLSGGGRVLEVGTLGGYSAIHMARALAPGGSLTSLEVDPDRAALARRNLARAGLSDRVEVLAGPALDALPRLAGPFDLVFLDADKPNNPAYLAHALRLARPGTVIVADNVIRGGAVADAGSTDPNVRGVRAFADAVAAEPRLAATTIQTVGAKGWDGFLMALVTS